MAIRRRVGAGLTYAFGAAAVLSAPPVGAQQRQGQAPGGSSPSTPSARAADTAAVARINTAAVARINSATITRHVAALTADSLRERPTPSSALEAAVRYVAAQLQRLGLEPLGDPSDSTFPKRSWLQHYPLPGQSRFGYAQSALYLEQTLQHQGKAVLRENGGKLSREAILDFVTQARVATEVGPPVQIRQGGLVLLTGPQTTASIAAANLADKSVLYVPPAGTGPATEQAVLKQLYTVSAGVVLLHATDSAGFAARLHDSQQQPFPIVDDYLQGATPWEQKSWAVELQPDALRDWLLSAGVDLTAAAQAVTPAVRALPAGLRFILQQDSAVGPRATAPNVVGLIEGTDSLLKQQYVVLSAHLDGTSGAADGAGSSDNTAGIAALLAVAEALRQPGAQPRRSVLVVATSGGASTRDGVKALWGAHAFVHAFAAVRNSAADLTLALSGQGASDSTVMLDGGEDVELTPSPPWLLATHPELALRLHQGGTVAVPSGDQFPFVRHVVPSLYLHDTDGPADVNADVRARAGAARRPEVASAADTASVAYTARVARLAFYLAESMANGPRLPHWTGLGPRRSAANTVP